MNTNVSVFVIPNNYSVVSITCNDPGLSGMHIDMVNLVFRWPKFFQNVIGR